jgi:hypothetical protein
MNIEPLLTCDDAFLSAPRRYRCPQTLERVGAHAPSTQAAQAKRHPLPPSLPPIGVRQRAAEGWRALREGGRSLMGTTSDRSDPRLTHGVDDEPAPMAEAYLVLSEDERAKGFVRPVRGATSTLRAEASRRWGWPSQRPTPGHQRSMGWPFGSAFANIESGSGRWCRVPFRLRGLGGRKARAMLRRAVRFTRAYLPHR